MSNPTEEQLFKAVKESLEKDGRLGRFKAQLRSSVMSILHTRQPTKEDFREIPEETKLINELLREYLLWNGYVYSENFLINLDPIRRSCLKKKLPQNWE